MSRITLIHGVPAFYCLACQAIHKIDTRFLFNYDFQAPTFTNGAQEIQMTVGPFPAGHMHEGKSIQCNFRIKAGIITYGAGSTHGQAEKTLGLPDFDELAAMRKAKDDARREMAARAASGRPD
jgi:hypothetical protein